MLGHICYNSLHLSKQLSCHMFSNCLLLIDQILGHIDL